MVVLAVVAVASAAAGPRETGEVMRTVITPNDQKRLARRIAEVESKTASEIVVAVLDRSAHYGGYRFAFATVFGLVAGAIATFVLPWLSQVDALGLEFVFVGLFGWATHYPIVLRRIVPKRVQSHAVSERAKVLFIDRGLTETRDRSGVLILLSALEQRVEIMGDKGVHEHLGKSAWATMVHQLTSAVAKGSAADGLEAMIDRLGSTLGDRFPARPDDTNELSNEIVTD